MNDFVQRHHALQQRRDYPTLLWNLLVEIGALDIRPLQNIFRVAEAKLVPNRGNISSHGTVPERNDVPRAFADFTGRFQVLLVADSAFDEASVNIVRVFFDIDDGAENEVDFLREFEKRLVEVKK